jgi:hypothetical protein
MCLDVRHLRDGKFQQHILFEEIGRFDNLWLHFQSNTNRPGAHSNDLNTKMKSQKTRPRRNLVVEIIDRWYGACTNAFQVMAMRLVLQMEAHRYHPYQQDDNSLFVSPPNLGKIDHLEFT